MRKIITTLFSLLLMAGTAIAQNDTMYVMKAGVVTHKLSIKTADVDSIVFYKPVESTSKTGTVSTPIGDIAVASIPAGTFLMGSPETEAIRNVNETQYSVTLTAFRMSKYEITNAQFAVFLNAKGIGRDGLYAAGVYPAAPLIFSDSSWGIVYINSKWIPVSGYESNPVINVTWYGAVEFASYVGGALPTEYACRAGTSTPFNTGNYLTNLQANYDWANPYASYNTETTRPGKPQSVGTYAANSWGLFDMHGNVYEWCGDWYYGAYPETAQVNPKGPISGWGRVFRGGSWNTYARDCRSASRNYNSPSGHFGDLGFRVVFVP
jgi:formylglycine-generating enzyme required for sulfatase activity